MALEIISRQGVEEQFNWEICSLEEDTLESNYSTEIGSEGASECDDDEPQERSSSRARAFSPEETLIIFDWDDTLLPTSWLDKHGLLMDEQAAVDEDLRAQLQELAERAEDTLREAQKFGKVVIITNAVSGWVEGSCARFLPTLVPALEGLRIVSARSTFETRGIRCPTQWKELAFEREVETFFEEIGEGGRCTVISCGDAVHEHRALLKATRDLPHCCAKSLKFAERPSLYQMLEEHALVAGTLEEVAEHEGDLDVDVGESV